MKKGILIFLFFLICFQMSSQVFKLGGVTVKELEETKHPFYKDADAAYLYKKGETYFEIIGGSFRTVTEVAVRLKIYTKAGYGYANVNIPYYAGRTSQKVKFSDVCTYNLVNGSVEKTKLGSDGKFEDEIVDNFKIKSIVMPNVKEGSVIEYRYKIINPFMTISDWNFQEKIPVNNVEYQVSIPDYFVYHKQIKGFVQVTKLSKPKKKNNSFSENITVYYAHNVMPFKEETYVDNINNYMSILEHDMVKAQFPGEMPHYFAGNWQVLCRNIYEDESFGGELNGTSYFKEDVDMLLKDVPQDKKLDTLFSFVKDRMTWNEVETEFCNKGVKKAYLEKTGNSAEINLMLTAILRYAGFDANPVLLSTRGNGQLIYPSPSAFNYVVVGVTINTEIILLDATSKNTVRGLLPLRALNWIGRMVKEKDMSIEVDLMPKEKSAEMISVAAEIDVEGRITGKVRNQYINHLAHLFRESYSESYKEKYVEELEKSYQGIEINDYQTLNLKDLSKPVGDDYSFAHNNIMDVIEDKLYFSPMLYFVEKENPFTAEKRQYPVDFMFPHQKKYLFAIKLPQGYVAETIPASVVYNMGENIGSFKYQILADDNMIRCNITFDINYANVNQDYYPILKDFYFKMIEKQNEKIVLKKA
ncbi:DUF3857 domain-containing protein [Flavobacterium sp. AG291]|uniref:DUF3857 domain-containing protein n=1 Tax=Flavobacterium sp. AG291 TaxID=2184000 RepID=UPI000E0BC27C|nr:DUF3857 domain-containing protein [Flavobacterium sp. AG291]RDI15931.1 uncharacterized protein DUF3857 [Flavobacterium sp. AG291]